MDSKVFAIDFFDDKLWGEILTSAGIVSPANPVQGLCFSQRLPFCKNYCGKIRLHLFTKRQWEELLGRLNSKGKTLLLVHFQALANYQNTLAGIRGGENKFFCVSHVDNELYVLKLKPHNCMSIPPEVDNLKKDTTIKSYIKNGLRTKVYTAHGKQTAFDIHNKSKKGWLYYFSKNKEYDSKEIKYCSDIQSCPHHGFLVKGCVKHP
jgi:hypothetical protein